MKSKIFFIILLTIFVIGGLWAQVTIEGDPYSGNPYTTIQLAIDACSGGEVINIAGTYTETATVNVNKILTIQGATGAKIETSGTGNLFYITSPGVIIQNLEIEKTDDNVAQNIIQVGAINFELNNCIMHAQFVMGDGETSRALEVQGSLTGLNIHNCVFHSFRQPAYINNNVSGNITNNFTYSTKGWVVVTDCSIIFTGNTWGSGSNINYYDIALINQSGSVNNYPDIVAVSNANNDAIIENQHSTYTPAILSIVHVDNTAAGGLNGSVLDPYADISTAITRVADGGTINVAAGTYDITAQMNIDKGISILGQGIVTIQANNPSWSTTNGYKHLIGIYAGTPASPVTISNITMDCNNQCFGLNTYDNAYGVLNNVTINNSVAAGLTVNGSTIIATNLNTSGNAWGAINVDPGSGVTDPSVFTFNSGTLAESNQIWSDGSNVTGTATVTVNAPGYDEYVIGDGVHLGTHFWTNRALTNCATINGGTTVYYSIQNAIDAANANDAITVATGVYEEQVHITVNNISITGAGVGNTVIKSPDELLLSYTTSAANYPIVFIDGVSEVLLTELTVDGANRGNDNYRFQGIGFWNSGGTLTNASVINVMDATFSGAQHAVGIYAYNNLGGSYTITMNTVLVDNYQKGGIAMNGTGLTANLTNVTTIGAGPTDVTAQNGIQFWGSGGSITDCNVTGNIYTGTGWASSGVLLLSHELITITNSHFGDNSPNIYNQEGSIVVSGGTITNTIAEGGNGLYNRIQAALPARRSTGDFEFKDASPFGEVDLTGYSTRGTLSAQISGCVITGAGSGYGISASNYIAADMIDVDLTNCTITNWGWGLVAYGSGGEVSLDIDESKIYGNGGGFYSAAALTTTQDATYNYWGPNGPEDLIAGNALYIPWYIDAEMTTLAGNPVTNLTQNTGYTTIQAAIDAANAGDVIEVAAGTYNEQVIVNKGISLIGNGASSTIIDGIYATDQITDSGQVRINTATGTVDISGFTITQPVYPSDTSNDMCMVISAGSDATVEIHDCIFTGYNWNLYSQNNDADISIHNNTFNPTYSNSICFEKSFGDAEIYENEINDGGPIFFMSYKTGSNLNHVTAKQWIHDNYIDCQNGDGIVFVSAYGNYYNHRTDGSFTNIEISNNIIENVGDSKKGIQLEMDGDGGGIFNSIIQGNQISAQNSGSGTNRGIRLLGTVTNTVIENNTITGMNQGIYLSGTWGQAIYPSGTEIHYNLFSNNNMAIDSEDTNTDNSVNATRNYWGDPTGPEHEDNPLAGLGDPVSDNVDFMPWYATATTTPATELATLKSDDGSRATIEVFTSDELATALFTATDGDNIILGSSTFTGNFTVGTGISISAADGAVPTIQGSDGNPALTIDGDNVSVSGVSIEANSGDEAVNVSANVTDGSTVSVTGGSIIADTAGKGVVNSSNNGGTVGGTVDATSNYWGVSDPTGQVAGYVDTGNPIVNDPVQISVSPATDLVRGGETATYAVEIGEVDAIGAYNIEIEFPKSDFSNLGIGDITLGTLFDSGHTLFQKAYIEETEEDHYTYLINCAVTNQTNVQVVEGGTGQLFTIDLTAKADRTNLDGSNINLNILSVREMGSPWLTIPCNGVTNGVVTIDSVVPVVDDITEVENGHYATAPIISSLGYSDNYNVATFSYQIDGTTGSWVAISGTASGTVPGTTWAPDADWTVPGFGENGTGLAEGSHVVYFQAIDKAGNTSANYSWQFNKDTTAPAALAWLVNGNNNYPETSVNSNNSIELQWDDHSESYSNIHIWRKAYADFGNSGYPSYTGTAPSGDLDTPLDPKAANDPDYNWTKITKANITSFTNTGMSRGYYYYAIYLEGLNGMISEPSVVSPALSYWLGDVNATPDGVVIGADIGLFSAAWNTTATGSILDVGPTSDYSRNALPTPDGAIGFEDLMIFAMNYENTNYTVYRSGKNNEPVPIRIELEVEQANDEVIARLILQQNSGFVKGVSIPIQFASDLCFVSAEAGDIWPEGTFFDHIIEDNVLEVSGSVLGSNSCIEGDGILAVIHFQLTGSDDNIYLQNMIARDLNNAEIEIMDNPTGSDPDNINPIVNLLGMNYPNPFNPTTTIKYGLKADGKVSIELYNIRGQKVKTLVNESQKAGYHTIVWNGKDDSGKSAASGIYFYSMKTKDYTKVRKAMLLK